MPTRVGHIYTLPSRILLATDLKDLDQILPVTIAYALKCKAALKLVHVQPEVNMPGIDSDALVHVGPESVRLAYEALEQAVKQARTAGVAASTWDLRRGEVAAMIVQIIQEWKADRVVVGSHGSHNIHQGLLGSVAGSILREVEIPVLAIGPASRDSIKDPSKKTRILLATALNRESFAITESIARFARSHEAELTMLHVIPEIAEDHPSAARVRSYAECKFQQILSSITGATESVSCVVETGQIVDTILRVAARGNFDLILLAGVSGSSFRTDIMPGTAYGVICRAPCPVLVIKEEPYRNSTRLPAA